MMHCISRCCIVLRCKIVSTYRRLHINKKTPLRVSFLFICGDGIRILKCSAGERCRRGLDRAEPLFLPKAKMQIKSCYPYQIQKESHRICSYSGFAMTAFCFTLFVLLCQSLKTKALHIGFYSKSEVNYVEH